MNKRKYKELKKVFYDNKGYARTKEITDKGIHTSYLYKLLEEGVISKIKRGLYHWDDYDVDNDQELVEVSKIVPNGVICLLSALSYYEMTTYSPWEYYIAIHRDQHKPVIPEYPPISIFYFADKQYNTGISEIKVKESKVKIYDLEKTICDCIRFRNKIGVDIVKEALNEYIKKGDRNLSKLINYARVTGVYSIVKKYLEVLI